MERHQEEWICEPLCLKDGAGFWETILLAFLYHFYRRICMLNMKLPNLALKESVKYRLMGWNKIIKLMGKKAMPCNLSKNQQCFLLLATFNHGKFYLFFSFCVFSPLSSTL